jgi:predicted nucleic acid-binding protein
MTAIAYDAGALIAADRPDVEFWADHRIRLESDIVPIVPAPVVAQVSRSPQQAQLRRLLRGCEVVVLNEADAHAAGELLGRVGASDVVDAVVVHAAAARGADIVTSDRSDIQPLIDVTDAQVSVIDV